MEVVPVSGSLNSAAEIQEYSRGTLQDRLIMKRRWSCLSIVLLLTISGSNGFEKLKTIYEWKSLEFKFPDEATRTHAIHSGNYIPGAPLPIDVDVYTHGPHKPMVFVSIPRFQKGVPVTLGYVTDEVSHNGAPLIAPFPNYEVNQLGRCDHITSVYRMKIDECNRLWVLDTGKLIDKQICPPKLHIFSLHNHTLIGRYKFPMEQVKPDSLFVTVAIDVRGSCEDTFAYVADVTGFQMLVLNYRARQSWNIINNLFYPYPTDGTFDIKNQSFDLMDGILGLALGPIRSDGDRILYFHSLASRTESWVHTSVIRDRSLFVHDPMSAPRSFVSFPKKRLSQAAAEAMNKDGVLFFGLMHELAIACWNSKNYPEYGHSNHEMVVVDPETLQFASGMKIITGKGGREELWVITPSFQKYMTNTLNPNETNFRIQAAFVDELVRGTKCDVASLNINSDNSLGSRLAISADSYAATIA